VGGKLSELLRLARPHRPTKFKAQDLGGLVILRGEDGAVAVVPRETVCELAERLNMVIEGFDCRGSSEG
jgi:hypothetical protein